MIGLETEIMIIDVIGIITPDQFISDIDQLSIDATILDDEISVEIIEYF